MGTWILAVAAILIDAPTFLVARGKPTKGGTILAVLAAAFLALLLAIGAFVLGLLAFLRANPSGPAMVPFIAGIVALVFSVIVLFVGLLGGKWH